MKTFLLQCGNSSYLEIWFTPMISGIKYSHQYLETPSGMEFSGLFDSCEGVDYVHSVSKHHVCVRRSFAHSNKEIYENVSRTLHCYFVTKGSIYADDPLEMKGVLHVKTNADHNGTFEETFNVVPVE